MACFDPAQGGPSRFRCLLTDGDRRAESSPQQGPERDALVGVGGRIDGPVCCLLSNRQANDMSYAALMVHLGGDRDWSKRVHLAADLASRFHSTLIGAAGWLPMPAFVLDDTGVGDEDTTEAEFQKMKGLLADMEQRFRASAKRVNRVEWRGMLDYPRDLVPREARAADLIIVGRERVPTDPYFALNPRRGGASGRAPGAGCPRAA